MDFKIIFNNLIIFSALAFNIEFVLGDINNLDYHNTNTLFLAIVFNILSTINKFGETNAMGNLIISSSLLSLIQLLIASIFWLYFSVYENGINSSNITQIVNIAIGALIFNALSVIMLIIQTAKLKR